MSHSTVQTITPSQLITAIFTINNYTAGGETVLASEIGATGVAGIVFATVPAGSNSLAVPLFPLLSGGKIMLYHFVSGAPVEIPTTSALNASITALVPITAYL